MPDCEYLMASATFMEAVYIAYEEEPDNEQVKSTVAAGLPHTVKVIPQTPKVVLQWIKEEFNKYNRVGTSWVERLADIGDITAGWSLHASEQNITTRNCGRGENSYDSKAWEYVRTHHEGKFASKNQLFNGLEDMGIYDQVVSDANKHCHFTNPRLKTSTVLQTLHELFVTISRYYRTIPKEVQALIFLRAARFAYPTILPNQPWSLAGTDTGGTNRDLIRYLECPMGGSTTYCAKVKRKAVVTPPKTGSRRRLNERIDIDSKMAVVANFVQEAGTVGPVEVKVMEETPQKVEHAWYVFLQSYT